MKKGDKFSQPGFVRTSSGLNILKKIPLGIVGWPFSLLKFENKINKQINK